MNTYIMLIRGINVGGKNILRMEELRVVLQDLGLEQVKTYIQSGNVVFHSAQNDKEVLAGEISTAVARSFGLKPQILLLTVEEWRQVMSANPFPDSESDPNKLHLFFLASPPDKPDFAKLEALKAESEQFRLIEQVFYLYAPEGIGLSRLATIVEKALGVPVTARNWRTVEKIMAMVEE